MQDTSSAAYRRRSDGVYRMNGLELGLSAAAALELEEGTWFENAAEPPVDTPLIELIPVPREALAGE